MEPTPLPPLHKMLERQIRKTMGDNVHFTPEFLQLLQRVSDTYTQSDDDHALIERSLELSSEELSAINKSIEKKVLDRTEELRREHIRFLSSINSLGVGFIMCNTACQITMINPAMQQLLAGKDHQDVVRADWTTDEVDGLLKPGFNLKVAINNSLNTGRKADFNHIELGRQILHLFVSPILAADKPTSSLGVVVLAEDITEQAIIERSKDEFFTIASHELRTPLTAIQGNASTMQHYYPEQLKDPELASIVSDIHDSAVRLIGIVNDFLDVSALEQGKLPLEPSTFSLRALVQEVERELEKLCSSKGLTLVVSDSLASLPQVTADAGRVKQVIYNLVGNAVKFTEVGSISLDGHAEDDLVYLSVTDTGRGMSPTDQRLLFHKFQQAGASLLTRDTPKGTGLGLYISKLIIEHSGGTIGLERSEVGKGSSFVFSLPQAKK